MKYVWVVFVLSLVYCHDDNSVVNNQVKDGINKEDIDKNEVNDVKESNSQNEQWSDVHFEAIAHLMSSTFRTLANEELGVNQMKDFVEQMDNHVHDDDKTSRKVIDYHDLVKELAKKMEDRIDSISSLLISASHKVEQLFQLHLRHGEVSSLRLCCDESLSSLVSYDKHFNAEITYTTACDTGSPWMTEGTFSPGTNLTDIFKSNLNRDPNIKWQFFISTLGVHSEFPAVYNSHFNSHCIQNDITEAKPSTPSPNSEPIEDVLQRHRNVYLSTVLPRRKNVLLVIDNGLALTNNQMAIAKAIGKFILTSLSHQDKVGVISLSSDVHYPNSDDCFQKQQLANANHETKYHLIRFIDSIQRSQDPTNHVVGLTKAFQILLNQYNRTQTDNEDVDELSMIVYVSRGLLSSLTDARAVMDQMANQLSTSKLSVMINTYALIDDSKPVMYETTFLKDLAEMNFKKYHVKPPHISRIKPGIMVAINSSDNLGFILSGIYSVLSQNHGSQTMQQSKNDSVLQFSLPFWDPISRDLQISVSQAVEHRGKLIGVIGLDISNSYLSQDIIYYPRTWNSDDSFAFLIEKTNGYVIQHPNFGRSMFGQPMHTDIKHLERHPWFDDIKLKLITKSEGQETINVIDVNQVDSNDPKFITYYWKHISKSPYVLVVGKLIQHLGDEQHFVEAINKSHFEFDNVESNFVYHRLDLALSSSSQPRLCRHLKQLATLETATLFLPLSSFVSPYNQLQQEETPQMVQRYMAYINDKTKLIINPGFKVGIRESIHFLARILSSWKTKLDSSPMVKFIVRKYVALSNVMMIYPGILMDRTYEPSRREWFDKAVKQSGQIVMTGPYIDIGGAGFIVTMSYAIKHYNNEFLVMAMDITLGYFQKFLLEVMPICAHKPMSCFLMDDRGYLLAHPLLVEPTGRGPLEQQHITHKEPLVANDLLNHKNFVSKKVCNHFVDRTIQRFYKFNTSIEGILTNMVHGEQCAKYLIVSLPGTNLFMGLVNQTCDSVTAFCPCSMIDRLCLNCHRLEQTDCECPCECPLAMDICNDELTKKDNENPICSFAGEQIRSPSADRFFLDSLPSCFEMNCYDKQTDLECLGVLGCEWCQLESNGVTHLLNPFCHHQKRCFGGIIGAATPYTEETIEGFLSDEYPHLTSTPVGPVAGGIMICFIVMALSVYCYRYHSSRQTHFIALSDQRIRHSHFNNEFEGEHLNGADEITPAPLLHHNAVVLASFENAAGVSPYRINPTYRRPPTESDHGYSTMTPHEGDSELAGPAFVEPLLIARDKQRLKQLNDYETDIETGTVTTSRTSSPVPSMTKLPEITKSPTEFTNVDVPSKLPLLAQVQVHMVDAN